MLGISAFRCKTKRLLRRSPGEIACDTRFSEGAQGCAYWNEVNGPRFAQAILTHQRTAGCTAVVIEINCEDFCKKEKV